MTGLGAAPDRNVVATVVEFAQPHPPFAPPATAIVKCRHPTSCYRCGVRAIALRHCAFAHRAFPYPVLDRHHVLRADVPGPDAAFPPAFAENRAPGTRTP